MNTINQKAEKIASQLVTYGTPQGVAFDPVTILTLIGVILQLIELLKSCYVKPENAQAKISGGPVIKYMMRNIIKKNINKLNASRSDIRALVFDIEKAIQNEVSKTTTEEFIAMYAEVK